MIWLVLKFLRFFVCYRSVGDLVDCRIVDASIRNSRIYYRCVCVSLCVPTAFRFLDLFGLPLHMILMHTKVDRGPNI